MGDRWWHGWRLPKGGRWRLELGEWRNHLKAVGASDLTVILLAVLALPIFYLLGKSRALLGPALFLPWILGGLRMGTTGLPSELPSSTSGPFMPVVNARLYGAKGDGVTDDMAAIQAALNAASFGQTVICPPTPNGYLKSTAAQLSIPAGVSLVGSYGEMQGGLWAQGVGIGSATPPGGAMFKITDATTSLIKMASNTVVRGFTFWYPNQRWNITSLGQAFIVYSTTIQLGLVAGRAEYNQTIKDCHILGPTAFIEQLDTTGFSVNGLQVLNCTGVVLGPFLRLNVVSDPPRLSNIILNPAYATPYVADGQVLGDPIIFRTKMAQAAKLAEFGNVEDCDLNGIEVYGHLYFVHFKQNMYTGDANQGGTVRAVNCIADIVHNMFYVERSSNVTVLTLTNCWATPVFRPNGVAGDSIKQGLIRFGVGVSQYRVAVQGGAIRGSSSAAFTAGYTDVADYAYVADGALGASVAIIANGEFYTNQTLALADANVGTRLSVGVHARNDVVAGGYRLLLDGWYQENVVASQVAVVMGRMSAASTAFILGWAAHRVGSLTSVWVKSNANRTGGTCSVTVFKNGVSTGLAVQLNAGNLSYDTTYSAKYAIPFAVGDILDLRVTTDAGWLPITADIMSGIEVEV